MEVDITRSMTASMDRKRNMGRCRQGSAFITHRRVLFPASVTRYMMQKGTEIQWCRCCSPGMPVRCSSDSEVLVGCEWGMVVTAGA